MSGTIQNDTIQLSDQICKVIALQEISLNKTKISVPRVNPCVISRDRVHWKLNQALAHLLTLVIAPMGYGKTTSVNSWLQTIRIKTAWLSLDAADSDPTLFWQYVFAALEQVLPGIVGETQYVFRSRELCEANVHIDILLNKLEQLDDEILLVIDDLHLIANPLIEKNLNYLIDRFPVHAHLLFISRTEPQLHLARFELRSQVLRITANDLRFRGEEIGEFYKKRDCEFDANALDRIGSYTEGWAAALVAIAVSSSLEFSAGGGNTLHLLPDIQDDLRQQLLQEVFSSYSPAKRTFLLRSSILEELREDLCDTVTGENDAQGFLREMSQRNEFLVSVGDENRVYRFHPILKDFLFRELNRTEPHSVTELHRRAALWYDGQGSFAQTVEHYLSGMHYKDACRLIESQLGMHVSRNRFETVLQWVERLPESYQRKSLKIAVAYSMYFARKKQFDRAHSWHEHAQQLLKTQTEGSASQTDRVLLGLALVNLLIMEEKIEELLRFVMKTNLDDFPFLNAVEYLMINDADICLYRNPMRMLIELFHANQAGFFKLQRIVRSISSNNPGTIPLVQGEFYYEADRLEEALPFFVQAMEEARCVGYAGALVPAMAGIARVRRARGDLTGAMDALDECENDLQAIAMPHWDALVRALKTRFLIETGNFDGVDKWIGASRLHVFGEINAVNEFELIVFARALLAKKHLDDAQILLGRLLAFAESQDRTHSKVEILILLSLLAREKGDALQMLQSIEKAMDIGIKKGYVRSFADEKEAILPVLKRAAHALEHREDADETVKSFAQRLVSLIQAETRACKGDDAADGVSIRSQLTQKEFKVLELLYGAFSNEEIASRLNIGLRTVKAHTGHIYSKLNVANRAQCVRLAREAGLFEES